MKVLIDADACPVTDLAIRVSREYGLPVLLICDCAHEMRREGAETLTVLRGADSADFALVNRLEKGDVVVTQDYGLAAMCLARAAYALNQNGMLYTAENIDGLLFQRHEASRLRRAGGRPKGPPKRTPDQDSAFEAAFHRLILAALTGNGDVL